MSDTAKNLVTEPVKKAAPVQPKQPAVDWKKEYESLKRKLDVMKEDKKADESAIYDKQKETRIVKGVFRFFDNKGGVLKWADRFPWKGATIKRYEVRDNETVSLPFYVARRLMNKGKVPVFTVTRDSDRKPVQRIKEYRRRFEFFPFDEELLKLQRPDLAEVERPSLITSL